MIKTSFAQAKNSGLVYDFNYRRFLMVGFIWLGLVGTASPSTPNGYVGVDMSLIYFDKILASLNWSKRSFWLSGLVDKAKQY